MPPDRVLSQEEIDSVFRNLREGAEDDDPARKAQPYDFRRPDRIGKDQLRAIHLLHENFARTLASSLSAYLRAYAVVNLVSVEQLSFMEFSQCLPSPSCMISLSMRPYDGNAILEINPALVFPIIEMLLGGGGKSSAKISRGVTEIEQSILEGLYRIVLHDLRAAWQQVCVLDFKIEDFETEPQLLKVMAPNEAVVAISMEVRIGENAGMMNLGIPSIVVKMLRQKFDQQWSVRRTQAGEEEHSRVFRLLKTSSMKLEARLRGATLTVEDLLQLEPGQVLTFDHGLDKPIDCLINGRLKFHGHIVNAGRKRAFHIQNFHGVDA
ncbi:MAG TPA: flagellar motor switch protein FliM [Bryobacteraceae bacterium]|jgi:flagellar motor switch protein FliM|nr:flagellar motor switch protein FliM [Bryobacteraceae bacterium]